MFAFQRRGLIVFLIFAAALALVSLLGPMGEGGRLVAELFIAAGLACYARDRLG